RRVQEQGKTQAADVDTIDLARLDVVGQQRPAPVHRRLRGHRRPGTRTDRVARARLEIRPIKPPGHGRPQLRSKTPSTRLAQSASTVKTQDPSRGRTRQRLLRRLARPALGPAGCCWPWCPLSTRWLFARTPGTKVLFAASPSITL